MSARVATATRLGFREQARRPLLIVLLVVLPFLLITRAIARTVPQPRLVALPGDELVMTTMRDLHGANMAAITIAFLAGLCGLFILQSAREADRRLVVAGFRPLDAIIPRLLVLAAATLVIVAVSLAVTAISFTPRQWGTFAAANLLIGVSFGSIGALAGAAVGRLGGTYFMFFLPFIDIGIAQNPMFGDARPDGWVEFLPGYGSGRVLVDASLSGSFHAWGELALAVAWALALVALVALVLMRTLGVELQAPRSARRPPTDPL